jgi:hypothetical protein
MSKLFHPADRRKTPAGGQLQRERETGTACDIERTVVYLPPALAASFFILSFFLCFLLSCSPPPVPAAASFSTAPTSFRLRLPSLAGVPASVAVVEASGAGADFVGVAEAGFGWS